MTPDAELLDLITAMARAVAADLGPGAEHLRPAAVGYDRGEPTLRAVGPVTFTAWQRGILAVALKDVSDAVWVGTGDGMVWVPLGEGPMRAVVALADSFSDMAVEVGPHFGSPIPACGLHRTHPMNPEVVDKVAVWRCYVSGTVVRPIDLGSLVG